MDWTRGAGRRAWKLTRRTRWVVALLAALIVCAGICESASAAPELPEGGTSFTIEKFQMIADTDSGFTTEELLGEVGQTVDYEIVVTNTSDNSLQFSPLDDPDCTGISPGGSTELEPEESETFTCETVLSEPGEWTNKAEIEADEERQASNEVIVYVPEAPAFTVEKLQSIKGTDSSFTASEIAGKAGQTVEYEIIVENTGNTPLEFSPLEDEACTNISREGQTELQAGERETFTCEHTLTSPGEVWANIASIESEEMSESSNEVVARASEEPEFTIEKRQQIQGTDAAFTEAELTAKLGQTVDYDIVVSNTGELPITFSPLTDPNCTGIEPAEATELEAGSSETFTCEHVLTSVGVWTNQAEIEGTLTPEERPEARGRAILLPGPSVKKLSSNKVAVNVPAEPSYEIEKLQSIKGSAAAATKEQLAASVGDVLQYAIVVRNTGNVAIDFSPLADTNCSNIDPAGGTEVAPSASETFTCERILASAGAYTNEATIEGAGKRESSNQVLATVAASAITLSPQQEVKAQCTVSEGLVALRGASGSKRKPFTVHIASLGIRQITFYLDGRVLKTLSSAQAKNGQFAIKIDPRKLGYGMHRLSVKAQMTEAACDPLARSAVFVHARPARVTPKFTG